MIKSESVASYKKAVKRNRTEAWLLLKELVDNSNNPRYIEALKALRPNLFSQSKEVPLFQTIVEAIKASPLTDKDLFIKFRIGPNETQTLINKALRHYPKEERVWIKRDRKSGIYKVLKIGTRPPTEYNGYLPKD